MTNTMNEQSLLDNGYKEFPKTPFCPEYASKAYQKCIRDDQHNRMYFINIYWYRDMDAYTADAQFQYRDSGRDEFMDVKIECVKDVAWLEQFIHNIWQCTSADMYERD